MNEQQDILERARQAGQPFKMPEGYFESLEDRLMARISMEEQQVPTRRQRIWVALKPALALAATFALIFGMGYGVLSLTHTLDGNRAAGTAAGYASAEEELILPSSIINYYQTGDPTESEEEIDEDTLIDYLATEMSFSDLAEIYAQSF
jgi:hypothetical protein